MRFATPSENSKLRFHDFQPYGPIAGRLVHNPRMLLACRGGNPRAFVRGAHPHTLIRSASSRSRRLMTAMAISAPIAMPAIIIHMRELICMPSWTGWAGWQMSRHPAASLMLS